MTSLVSCLHSAMPVQCAGLARSPPGRVGCTSPSLAGDLLMHFLLVPANMMEETGHKHYDNKILRYLFRKSLMGWFQKLPVFVRNQGIFVRFRSSTSHKALSECLELPTHQSLQLLAALFFEVKS